MLFISLLRVLSSCMNEEVYTKPFSLSAEQETSPVKTLVQDVTDVACGAEFTVWLTKKGIW